MAGDEDSRRLRGIDGLELKPLPHREAIEYFRSKGYAPALQRFHHLDHFREEHARDWVVAKAMRDEVSQAIRGEVERVLTEGLTLEGFQETLKPRLQELGWWGESIERDPVTGEMVTVKLGSMRRLRTIWHTNMSTAHAAGKWARIQRTKDALPYLHYIQIERPSKRHSHARFHDRIWRVDDPVWLRIFPPNGWFCGCTAIQRTEGWMRRNGRVVSPPLDLEEEEWTNKRTGEVYQIPAGVHPGFDTNPGAVWLDIEADWERMTPDLTPERRASERGVLQGLRLQRLSDPREALVVLNGASEPVGLNWAQRDRPDVVIADGLPVAPGATFMHSHISDATLSAPDLYLLSDSAGYSMSAITPGGSLWRAVREQGADLRPAISIFAQRIGQFKDELTLLSSGGEVFAHARLLWLEKNGLIRYSYRMSERVRQSLEVHSDLIRRLIDG